MDSMVWYVIISRPRSSEDMLHFYSYITFGPSDLALYTLLILRKDLDWEYPQAEDRGGVKADTANYVALVKEMKAAFGSKYGISVTLPTSFWYLQHFDLVNMEPHVDWFNLMSYDRKFGLQPFRKIMA